MTCTILASQELKNGAEVGRSFMEDLKRFIRKHSQWVDEEYICEYKTLEQMFNAFCAEAGGEKGGELLDYIHSNFIFDMADLKRWGNDISGNVAFYRKLGTNLDSTKGYLCWTYLGEAYLVNEPPDIMPMKLAESGDNARQPKMSVMVHLDKDSECVLTYSSGIQFFLERIPAGEFGMGSPEDEIGRMTKEYWQEVYDFAPEKAEEFHRHTEEIRRSVVIGHAFWLGRFPVTREQYASVVGADLSILENGLRPMTQVRWEDAVAFCEKLNDLCREQLPTGYRFALPTEEQWEYACRARTTTALNSGRDLTQGDFFCPNLAELAWFQMNSGEHKRDVGLLKPNAWGLYDMHGNVWEWCVCATPVDDSPLSQRILRGGSWYDPPRFCRAAMRRWLGEDRGGSDIGFRVALVPIETR